MGRRAARTVLEIKPNYRKLVDVVLCMLRAAEKLGTNLTQFDIVKAAFFADIDMLDTYGVPITFDIYKAMKHGPVGSALFDLLAEQPGVLAKTGPVQWSRTGPAGLQAACTFSAPRREVDEEILNPAEIEAIEAAIGKVKRLGFGGVSNITHKHPAWEAAWRARGDASSWPMDYALMLPRPTQQRLEDLAHLSRLAADD